jgi:hypothetical protein
MVIILWAGLAAIIGTLPVGTCLESTWLLERWETKIVKRIEEVGRESYRTSLWDSQQRRWIDGSMDVEFSRVPQGYRRVPCPR